ncbi:DNA-methyltransferase [Chromobacterium subtsugae]|uniref:DNA-methyltransferase n=1 Tax=Chromobacterium subtsugae TaxID=251747 RepID=UPI0009BAE16F|nr:site-specific DNA-methyltransferase [Chromobacterium subtsugae]
MNAPEPHIYTEGYAILHQENAKNITHLDFHQSINLTLTSPPYFDLKDYGSPDQIGYGQSYENYLDDLTNVFKLVHERTAENGSLWIVIDTFMRNGELITLPFDLKSRLSGIGWQLNDIIIWKKDRTLPWLHSGTTRNIFEYILVFSKSGQKMKYFPDRVREHTDLKKWWVRYPERYSPKGKALEEVWNIDIPTQGSWGKSTPRHFCPFPSALVRRIIKLATDKGDLVFDPFAGTGSVLVESHALGRNSIGTELNSELVHSFNERISTISINNYDDRDLTAEDFEKTIHDLRILKYAKTLLKKVRADMKLHQAWMFASLLDEEINEKHQFISAEFKLITSHETNNTAEILEFIESLSKKAPLSKFGIVPKFNIYTNEDSFIKNLDPKKQYFQYTPTNTHQSKRSIISTDIPLINKFIISPIYVNVEEPNE